MIELNHTLEVQKQATKKLELESIKRGAIIRASLGINPGLSKREIDEIKS